MARMTDEQMEEFLASGDHKGTAILSVSSPGRGPISVPLAFRFEDGTFRFSTKRSRLHARAFEREGRGTLIVHHERYGGGPTLERYVTAEGPITIQEPPGSGDPFVTAVLAPERLVGVVYGD